MLLFLVGNNHIYSLQPYVINSFSLHYILAALKSYSEGGMCVLRNGQENPKTEILSLTSKENKSRPRAKDDISHRETR